jgi:DNA repair exonuclease SbcCD ATPase subunit
MLFFEKIRWKNFLSTGNAFTEINFTKNKTTLIVGENGAGKSTILDALSFSLYGKPFRKVNKPQLLNAINGKGLLVELEFTIGKRHYLIKRGMKPNLFEIYQDGVIINQDAEAKEYQEMFEKNILKLNHKSFCQIVVLGSASFVPFMQLPAAHRREVIEDLLDIQIFSTMNNLLKDKVSKNRSDLTDVDYNIKLTAQKIEMHKKHLEELSRNNDEVITQKDAKIAELAKEISNASSQSSTLLKEVLVKTSSISDQEKVGRKIEKLNDLNRQLQSKLTRLENEIEFFNVHDDCPTCRQGIKHEHKAQIVSRDNDSILEVRTGLEKLNTELVSSRERLNVIAAVNREITDLNRQVSNLNVQVETKTTFIDDLKKEIEVLKKSVKVNENNEDLKLFQTDLKKYIADKEELVTDKGVLDVASNLLRDSGIKTKIIKQYIPVMNKLINKYLASLDFFVNFELNENFEEKIKSRHRDEFSYESFSEGEKMRIDLALLFTWRAIAKLRNSVSTNLLIMDEVFDSSLDVNGTDEFLKILYTLTGDTNVFIISHKGDTLFDKFEHIIKFEKHKNFSRIAS